MNPPLRFSTSEDWTECQLKDICEINPSVEKIPDTFQYIDLESVTNGRLLQTIPCCKSSAPSRAKRILSNEDVLFQTVRPYQKNNYFFKSDSNTSVVASTGYAQLRCTSNSAYFLYTLIHTDSFVNQVLQKCTGGAYPAITASSLSTVKINIPVVQEQQKIASFFSTLDQKIEINERKLEALEKLKKGVTQKILNKKIRFQKDDGTDFPDTVSCSLRDISAYSKCNVEKKNSLFIGNEQLISNFGGATLNFREVAKGNEFNSGDILFGNIRPYLKKVWLSNESGVASPDVLIFKATNAIPGYLKFILSSERFFNHVAQGYKGSKMPRGDKHQIMDFSIQCPCLEEQQKIADFLSALDSKIDIKRKTVATMRDLKRGLMQQMFV